MILALYAPRLQISRTLPIISRRAAVWKPDLTGLNRNWGLSAYRAELYSEDIAPLERQLAASPEDAFVRQLLGLSCFMTDNFARTVEVLRPFLNNPPDDPGIFFALGSSLVRMRQTEPAMGIFRRLLEQNAGNPAVHLLLGQAYAQQDDFPNSIEELKNALKIDPRLPQAHYYAGLVYLRSDFDSAAKEFHDELEIRPVSRSQHITSVLPCSPKAKLHARQLYSGRRSKRAQNMN